MNNIEQFGNQKLSKSTEKMKRKKQNLKDTNKNEKKIENNPPQKSEISQNQKESLVLRHKIGDLIRKEKSESVLKIMTEVVNPYLVAGFGMVLAGNVLNAVKVRRSMFCV